MSKQIIPMLYKIIFLLPSWGRKSSYVVLAEGAGEAIEVARKAVEDEHGTAVFDEMSRHEPRWVTSEAGGIDLLSPSAFEYYAKKQAESRANDAKPS